MLVYYPDSISKNSIPNLPLAFDSEIQDIQESDQRDDEAQRHILLADISHQHRTESAAGNSHHDIRRGFLGINAHTFQPQRENRREHDGHEEKDK